MNAFRAHCAQGHSRIDFTDRAAFEDHMTIDHGAKMLQPGGAGWWTIDTRGKLAALPAAPGWRNGKPEAPHAWAAPRRSPGGIEKVARDLEAGKYDLKLHWRDALATRLGEAVA